MALNVSLLVAASGAGPWLGVLIGLLTASCGVIVYTQRDWIERFWQRVFPAKRPQWYLFLKYEIGPVLLVGMGLIVIVGSVAKFWT